MSLFSVNEDVLSKLDSYLSLLKSKWDALCPQKKSWFSLKDSHILDSVVFIIEALDNLILFVQNNISEGSDKKAIVMMFTSKLFDYIVIESFPVCLKPFAPTIKKIVIDIIISELIEFMVQKYKEGSWTVQKSSVHNEPDQFQSIVYFSKKESKWKQ
jgi:hypothetical protein